MQDEGPSAKRARLPRQSEWPIVPSYYGLARWFPRDVRKLIYAQLTWEEQAVAHVAHAWSQLQYDQNTVRSQVIDKYAAERGYISLMKWRRTYYSSCCDHREMCVYAASSGQLVSLQWLREQEMPTYWDYSICTYAASNGHLELLRWAYFNGYAADPREMFTRAELFNRTHVMEWIRVQFAGSWNNYAHSFN